MCVGLWRRFKFQLEGLKIEFKGIFKQKEQFDPNFCCRLQSCPFVCIHGSEIGIPGDSYLNNPFCSIVHKNNNNNEQTNKQTKNWIPAKMKDFQISKSFINSLFQFWYAERPKINGDGQLPRTLQTHSTGEDSQPCTCDQPHTQI